MKKSILFSAFIILNLSCLISFAQSPPPSITSFTPSSGPAGTTVKIVGNDFNLTLANNVVYFGATKATVTAATSSTLTVTAPVGATYQYITVTDPTYPGTAYATSTKFIETFSCGGAVSSSSFTAKSDFTTATKPYGDGLCDIDGDGKADIVTANGTSNSISVLRNTSSSGTISFAAKVDFATGTGATNVAFGDINGDGKPDVVVCNNNSSTVSVLKNTSTVGSISFSAKVDFTVGTLPWNVVVNDINGDGSPDIIIGNKSASTVGILRNTSSIATISFAAMTTFATGSLPFGLAVGDLDGDGKADIVTANEGSDNISVLKNTGGTTFAAKVDFPTGTFPVSVAIGDLDGDGYPEIACANSAGISVLKNTGNFTINVNTFATKVDFATGASPWWVTIADVDGDGKPDLSSANNSGNSVSILRNTTTTGVINSGSFATNIDFTAGSSPYCVAVGDIDGDGKPDIAAANSTSNTVSCYRNLIYVTPTMTSANTTTVCTGTNVSFSFASDMASTYQWIAANNANTTGESTTLQAGNILSDVIVNNTSSPQNVTYTVTPTSSANGCAGTAQTLTVTVKPNASIGIASGVNTQTVCVNTPITAVTYSVSGGGTGAGVAGLPAGVNGIYSSGTFSITGTPSVTGTFNYTVTTAGTCTQAVATGTLTVKPDAAINLTSGVSTQTLCIGTPITAITYSVSGGGTGAGAAGLPAGVSGIYNSGTFTISGTPTASGTFNYTVTTTGTCLQAVSTGTFVVNPLPVISFSGLNNIYCYNASAQTLTPSPSGGTFSGAGVSGNTFTPSIAGAGTQTVTYTYTNGNSCTNSSSQITQVAAQPLTPAICLITVDSLSQNNLIVWDKTSYVHGDTFLLYRDTANNAYGLIGMVPFDSLSLFADTARTLYAANGDPNVTSWRYKLAVKDTCGNTSALSLYHQSIYIQNSSGNFSWNDYKIEGQPIPVPALTNYIFQRDNLSNGNYTSIGTLSASSTAFTDPSYAVYQNTATWRVKTVWSIACTATIINPKNSVNSINLNSSRSNIYRVNPTSVNENFLNYSVNVYPNPTSGKINVQMSGSGNMQMKIYNIYGECMYQHICTSADQQIDLSSQPSGVYFLKIIDRNGASAVKKIIKE